MNKIFLRLWLFTLGSLLLHSCTQNEVVPEVECQENEMRFQISEGASRSFIDGNLSTENTKIEIYGYHDNKYLMAGDADKKLEGKSLIRQSDGSWVVVSDKGMPIAYFWQDKGTYRFFGWLTHDAASGKSIPFNLTYSEGKLSIPETVVNKDYSQFDFLYSSINHRIMTSANFNWEKEKPVSMDMNHLLSAFAIGIRNTSEDDIVIKSVKLNCIHDKGSVNIDYSESVTADVTIEAASSIPPVVQYGSTTQTAEDAFLTFSGEHHLKSKTGYSPNIFTPSAEDKRYYMVWPQNGEVLNATSLTFANEDEEAAEPDSSFPMVLEYTVGGEEIKKRIRFPKENWEPGKKYYLEVQLADKLVQIITTVSEWDYTDSKVDFSEHSISVKEYGHLQWDPEKCTIDHIKKEVYVTNGAPVEGTFAIDAPQGGQWRVSLEGDVTAFSIVDDAVPTDDGFGPIDGKVHRIKIVPTIATPERDYKVTLKFVALTADHKTYPADDMIQDNNNDAKADIYTVVLRSVK